MDVFNLLAKISLDSSEYEQSLSDAEKKTSSFGSGLKKGFGTATKIGAGAVVALGGAVVTGTKALVSGTSATAQYGDQIDKTSQKLGLSTDAYQEWDYVLNLAGTEMSSMTTGLKTLTNKIDDAKNGSEDAQEMFAKLGISMEDLASMSREDIFASTIYGFQQMEDSTERAALANDLYGKSGQNLTPLFNQTAEATQEQIELAREYGMIMSEDMVSASARYQDSLTTAQGAITGLKNKFMGELLPSFADVIDGFASLVAGTDESGEQFSQGIENAIDAVVDLLPKMLDVGGKLVVSLINGIVDNLPKIVGTAKDLLSSLIDGILDALPMIIDMLPEVLGTAMDLIFDVLDGILDALPSLIEILATTLPNLIQIFMTKLIENLPRIVEGLINVILAIAENLPKIVMGIIDMLPTIIQQLISALVECLPQLIQGAIQLVLGLVAHLPEIITGFIEALPQIIDAVINGLMDALPQLIYGLIQLTIEITKHLPEIVWGLIQAIPEIGKSIVEGLWEGISSMATWLWDNVGGFFTNIWDGIKGIFDVHSPSKKMAWLGEMMTKGLSKGIDDTGDNAIDSALDMANGINKVMEDTLSGDMFSVPDIATTQNYQVTTASIANTGEFNMLVDAFRVAFKDVKVELDGDEMGGFVDRTMTRLVYS